MKTIIRKYNDKEYVMKLGARQKKLYSDLTNKPILTSEEPTYSDMITLIDVLYLSLINLYQKMRY